MANSSLKKSSDIIIDKEKGLVFSTEEKLFAHFKNEVELLEKEFLSLKSEYDFTDKESDELSECLAVTLEQPDEVWLDKETLEDQEVSIYVREFEAEEGADTFFYVAMTYLTDGTPSFVYLHFPTKELSLVEKYQRGELVYDRILEEAPPGAIDGDALVEGDELAVGLYKAMLLVRSHEDVLEANFRDYSHLRESAIEEAEEIWRSNDSYGNVLVNFIREFPDEGVTYVVCTVEDAPSNTHALLFSFPTKDKNLLGRYRQGENLQAEEVTQESPH